MQQQDAQPRPKAFTTSRNHDRDEAIRLATIALTTTTQSGRRIAIEYGLPIKLVQDLAHQHAPDRKVTRHSPALPATAKVIGRVAVPEDFAERNACMTTKQLATNYRMDRRTINRLREGLGLPHYKPAVSPLTLPTPADLAQVAARMTHRAMEAHYGVSSKTIRRWVNETGVRTLGHVARCARSRPKAKRTGGRWGPKPAMVERIWTDEDEAQRIMQRAGWPCYRCDEGGNPNPTGKMWRLGRLVVSPAELIERADAKRARAA